MKIKVCDICYRKDHEIEECKYRIKFGGLSLDTCDKHKGFFKKFSTIEEATRGMMELYNNERGEA